jgi:hypothetical protein
MRYVRFGSLTDIGQPIRDVRFAPKSGHVERQHRRLLSANSAKSRLPSNGDGKRPPRRLLSPPIIHGLKIRAHGNVIAADGGAPLTLV